MALPALIGGWVAASLATGIGTIIARGLLALGIGYTTYTFLMPPMVNTIAGYLSAVPLEVRGAIGLAKIDVFITMVFSAITAKMAMRLVWRKI